MERLGVAACMYEGDLGFASLNLNFYGLGDDGDFEIRSTEVNLEGIFTSHEVKFRWKESNFFIGGRYQLFDADFDFSQSFMEIKTTLFTRIGSDALHG